MTTVCYLCGSGERRRRDGKVRDAPELPIWECLDCGLVYLGQAAQRSSDFYADSGMHGDTAPDARAWLREGERDDWRRAQFLAAKMIGRRVLDFGCGAGGFLAHARVGAASVTGIEPERRLVGHFQSLGLEVVGGLDDLEPDRRFDLITAFHVVEHLPDPRKTLRELSGRLVDGRSELVVEVPAASDALLTLYGSRAFAEFTYWSCHLYLFTAATLRRLGEEAGLRVNFIRQVQRYPLSNHLHWLAAGGPGGHQAWGFLDTPELERAYEASLASLGLCDTLIAGFSLPE